MEKQSDKRWMNDEELKSLASISKERKLPMLPLGNQQYWIDITNGELRNVKDPMRTISFDAMTRIDDQYSFMYDTKNDKIILDKGSWGDLSTKQWIDLPAIDTLDPGFVKRMVREHECQEEFIRHGESVYNDQGVWRPKDTPLLPMINFYGTEFFLDLKLREFRQVENPGNRIPWKALKSDDYHYSFFFDAYTKNVYQGPKELIRETPYVKSLFLPPVDIMIEEGIERHQKMIDTKKDNAIYIKVSKKRNFKR